MDIRRYAAFLLLLLASTIVRATHIGGGEIYWDHLGGNQYRITLIVYRDCAGVTLDNGYNLDITSPCGTMQLCRLMPPGLKPSGLASYWP